MDQLKVEDANGPAKRDKALTGELTAAPQHLERSVDRRPKVLTSATEPAHIPALDGVRGIAFLLVLFCHTSPKLLPGGPIGVDLFFVLSGFLITSILLQERRERGSIHIGRFYLRRALRLLPALFLVIAFCLIYVFATQGPEKLASALDDAQSVSLYYWNWRLVLAGPAYAEHQQLFLHMWSLSVEEQFYIIWPVILIATLAIRIPLWAVFALIVFGIVAPAVARAVLWQDGPSFWLYARTDLHCDGLLWGALVAFLVHYEFKPNGRFAQRILSWGGVAALLGLIWVARYELVDNGLVYRGVFTLVGFMSALLIAVTVWFPPAPLRFALEVRPLRWIGRISYGLYLWHVPIFAIAIATLPFTEWSRTLPTLAVIFIVASLSYRYVEAPCLRLKDRLSKIPLAPPHAVGSEPTRNVSSMKRAFLQRCGASQTS